MAITSKDGLVLIISKWKYKFSASQKLQGFDVTKLKALTGSAESLEPQRVSDPPLL